MKNNNILEKQKELEKELIEDSKLEKESLFQKYKTSIEGVSIVDIEEKQEMFGKNTIEFTKNNTIFHKLKEAFINPFNVVLIIVAIVTFGAKKQLSPIVTVAWSRITKLLFEKKFLPICILHPQLT